MEPTLHDGDWLMVDPLSFVDRPPRVGEIVVASDPRAPTRSVVKRVRSIVGDQLLVGGDHPAHGDESLEIAASDLRGRPWLRYWPLRRLGWVR
jgi:signal peptidase I